MRKSKPACKGQYSFPLDVVCNEKKVKLCYLFCDQNCDIYSVLVFESRFAVFWFFSSRLFYKLYTYCSEYGSIEMSFTYREYKRRERTQ